MKNFWFGFFFGMTLILAFIDYTVAEYKDTPLNQYYRPDPMVEKNNPYQRKFDSSDDENQYRSRRNPC